ncbi:unnamed protein product [Polarella glacialis]|uniref:Uncharacterized protein n=1 Tax=Polarella glacialis TaxID=89957 RepID=A0A813FK07_POLGL|nr:unnamed protein product [Polarella glacialis]CAE8631492.1 unnamed protein product [Polarella glacialis]
MRDDETAAGAAAEEASASSTASTARAFCTADARIQTDKPWPPPLPEQEDCEAVWISEHSERFHLTPDCRGLRSARRRICKTRCTVCG